MGDGSGPPFSNFFGFSCFSCFTSFDGFFPPLPIGERGYDYSARNGYLVMVRDSGCVRGDMFGKFCKGQRSEPRKFINSTDAMAIMHTFIDACEPKFTFRVNFVVVNHKILIRSRASVVTLQLRFIAPTQPPAKVLNHNMYIKQHSGTRILGLVSALPTAPRQRRNFCRTFSHVEHVLELGLPHRYFVAGST
jgi:hypothetical protein